jgi:uncharacterized repeat protein (TIGR01451 family)
LCAWDVGGSGLPHGTQFSLSARATDTLGQTSGWTTPQPVRLDVLPPVLRVTSVLTTTVVRGGTKLFGTAIDESGMAVVWVCVDGECGRANLLATDGESTSWMYPLPASPADYVDKTISIEGIDRVGNRTAALRAVVTLDNVPPELTGIQLRVQEPLGEQMRVLQGEARDGDPSERVFILVRAPDNAKSWHNAARSGELWWYDLTGEMPGRHSLWVQAVDRTGNARTKGPYTVDVTCTDAGLATTLSVEPGTGSDYTVSAVISNTGPAPSPAGVQVTLYADETPLAAPSVLPALTKGQASAVSAQWTRPGPGGYEFRAVVTQPQAEVLCATPPAGHARVGPDVDLRISKTVQPAAARPGDVITYMLVYTNAGAYPAAGVTISDPLPAEILSPTYQSTGAVITPTVGSDAFAWEVEDLAGGLGGRIVITGTVDPAATPPFTLTNTVTITTLYDTAPADNVASVELRVLKEIEQPTPRVWLPWVVR